jgi:Uma2 family endonuclease
MALHDLRRRKLTYEDYCLIPEDGQRHEILDGEHYVTPAPFLRHQRISSRLHVRLGSFIERQGLGEFFSSPVDVVLSRHDVVQPDLLFISNERARIAEEKNIQGAPDLVIEIFSKSTRARDEGLKLERYELLGVTEYWTVDPETRTARIYRRQGDRLKTAAAIPAGGALSTPLLPGLEIVLSEIFE